MARFNIAGLRPVLVALLTILMAALLGCSGGSVKVVEPDNIDIHPTVQQTITEQMQKDFGPSFHGLFESYDAAGLEFLRVVWKNPAKQTLRAGDSVTFGVDQVYAKAFDTVTKSYKEVPVTTYQEVQALLAGFGRFTAVKMTYEALGDDLDPGKQRESTVSVGFSAEVWSALWNKISNGKLDTYRTNFGVVVTIVQGYVQFQKSDPTNGIVAVTLGALWWAAQGAAVTGCPDLKKSWMFDRPADTVPPPTSTLSISGPASATAGSSVTITVNSNISWTATWPGGGSHSGSGNNSWNITMPSSDLTVTVTGSDLSDSCTVTLTTTPPTPTLSISGPSSATAGTSVTITVNSNINGWTATWSGGSHTGNGNDSWNITMPNNNLVVTVTGSGLSDSCTVTLTTTPPPPTGLYELQALPSSWAGELDGGYAFEFRVGLKSDHSFVASVPGSVLTSWTVSPTIESWSYETKGEFVTFHWNEATQTVDAYVTPGSYVAHATYTYEGENLAVDIPLQVDYKSSSSLGWFQEGPTDNIIWRAIDQNTGRLVYIQKAN
jgi:hypothetical protein